MRAIGARASSRITRKFGMHALPEGRLHIRLEGSAGQSLGAFSVQGLLLEVFGDANDYVGKGLSGATIVVTPRPRDRHSAVGDAIIGNTCLYGATSGKLFAAGTAGVRFAVRNSGARAVVEGCGANGCEYMTGGRVLVLGPAGDNFGAGMTGGAAFIWDPQERFARIVNAESIDSYPLRDMPEEHIAEARALLEEHVRRTGSVRARELLDHWEATLDQLLMVVPKEIAGLLLAREPGTEGRRRA
jgi:glutamate synthase (NADPH/NADH) large chain